MPDTDPAAILRLEGELTIYTAAEIRLRLLETLAGSDRPLVDLSAVTEVDTAGLQLLILAKREAARSGKPLCYQGHSQAVLEILTFCNLIAPFGDPIDPAPQS